jgi:hypothetical protein
MGFVLCSVQNVIMSKDNISHVLFVMETRHVVFALLYTESSVSEGLT